MIFLTGCFTPKMSVQRTYGSHLLAWHLRQHGYQAKVFNFLNTAPIGILQEALQKHLTPQTRLLGLSMIANIKDFRRIRPKIEALFAWVRETYPQVKFVAGGPAATINSAAYPNGTLFDYVFTGFSENILLELCDHLYRGGPAPKSELNAGNVALTEKNADPQRIRFSPTNYNFLWSDEDHIQPGETLPLELSRGCIFSCRFCAYPYTGKQMYVNDRHCDCIERELRHNYEKWGVTNYIMLDETFNASLERNKSFLEVTRRLPFKINYSSYCRLDLIASRPGSEEVLYDSGLRGIFCGVETFNLKASVLIKKAWHAQKGKEFLPKLMNQLWDRKVAFNVGMIAGIPPETFDELKDSNQWLIDQGAHQINWTGLNISKNKTGLFLSEFDRNAEKYGFTWIKKNGMNFWKHEHTDQLTAHEWARALKEQAKPSSKYACWRLMEVAQFGYDIDVMRTKSYQDLTLRAEIDRKRQQFLANYWGSILQRNVDPAEFSNWKTDSIPSSFSPWWPTESNKDQTHPQFD